MKTIRILQTLVAISILSSCVYQRPDMQADMSVDLPRFDATSSPLVLFDAGHGNFHDIQTTYKPFATLLENDGVLLSIHQELFSEEALNDAELLIIANATSTDQEQNGTSSAFSESEIQVLTEWVQRGGSLLLIADHDPFGSAAAELATALGVGMESVWTVDTLRMNQDIGRTTWLEFSRENHGLGEHGILQLDSPPSTVKRVITFTGQSLDYDSTWTSILQLSTSAQNYYTREDAAIASVDSSSYFSVPGQSQLIARKYGEGRIVIAGEAAMFTAQEVRIFFKTIRAGFNYPGYDNKNFVLNVIHWLLGEIE